MSLEFMDNFQSYGTSQARMLDGVYAQASNSVAPATDPDGVSTGKCCYISGTLRRVLSSTQTTVGVAFRMWKANLPVGGDQSSPRFLSFADAANAVQVGLWLETTGAITVRRGSSVSGTILGQTTTPAIVAGAWNHLEVKVLFSQTVGTVEVRVNGLPVIEEDTLDTCNTLNVECSQVHIATADNIGFQGAEPFYAKDIYIWNGSGSVHNDFVGDVQVVALRPVSDNSLNWTPSTGSTGYNLIDETTPDDTDYIVAGPVVPDPAVFELTNLDDEVVTVKGLMIFNRMLKTDGGTAKVVSSIVSNGDSGDGSEKSITVAATYWTDTIDLDPDTAAAWSPTSVNNAKLKINRTT